MDIVPGNLYGYGFILDTDIYMETYTSKMPVDIALYQIDFVLVRKRLKILVKYRRRYPRTDVNNDNTIMGKRTLKFKKLNRRKAAIRKTARRRSKAEAGKHQWFPNIMNFRIP